jgi:hypothetical protein
MKISRHHEHDRLVFPAFYLDAVISVGTSGFTLYFFGSSSSLTGVSACHSILCYPVLGRNEHCSHQYNWVALNTIYAEY